MTVFFIVKFEINILGSGAATPTLKRNPTAQLIDIHDKYFLVDCGEGTQMALRRNRLKFQRINHIFISHLHGDHYLGLIGLISSMHLLGRTKSLTIFGPPGLDEIIAVNLKHSETYLSYELIVQALQPKNRELILDDKTLEVYAFPLKHRIPCSGYLFREKPRKPKVDKEAIAEYNLTVKEIVALKNGENIIRDGKEIPNSKLTSPAPNPRSYAFCSDTAFSQEVAEFVRGVDLLYHEATFLDDKRLRAKETFHSTAGQAATVARDAGARALILGHFSSRYRDLLPFTDEASAIFPDVRVAEDGDTFSIEP